MQSNRCADCNKKINLTDRNVVEEMSGWVKPRGNFNLMFRQKTGRVMCGECYLRHKAGVVEQGRLL